MAGGEHLNPVDYPPPPSVQQNQNKKQSFLSSQIPDRNNIFSAAKVLTSTSIDNHESIDLVVGSVPIPPITAPLMPQISIPTENNRLSPTNPKQPSILMEPQKQLTPQPCLPSDTVKAFSPQHKDNTKGEKVQGMEMSNLAKAFMGNYEFQPCYQILGTDCISFSMEDKQTLINSMNFIVIVKFSHSRPKFHVFNSFLMNMGFLGKFRIMDFDLKHVFVEFLVFEDFCKLWMLKSCSIGGFWGRFFKWDGNLLPNIESFMAPIWVHLPHFPLYLFNEKAIMSVARVFGKPMFIDPASLNRSRVGKLSVCVAKDVRVKGPNEIMVEFVGEGIIVDRFSQMVNYGEIPDYCSRCFHLGHSVDDCKLVVNVDKPLGAVFNRLTEGGNSDVSSIPIASVFNRINADMKEKVTEGDKDLVLVEDVTENEQVDCGLSYGVGMFNLQEDNFTAPTSEPKILTSEAEALGSVVRTPLLLSKAAEKADMILVSVGEKQGIAAGSLSNAVSSGYDSSAEHSLELHNMYQGAVIRGSLAGDLGMVSKDHVNTDKCLESSGEEVQVLAETSVDELQNKTSNSEILTDQFLKASNLISGAVGEQAFGVLERGVGDLQLSSRLEAITVVEEEIIAVEKEVLQKNSANCVECATLNENFSQLEQDMQAIPGATDSLLGNLKVTEKSLAKSHKGCSETEFENRKNLQSAADSVREATLQEDISQLKQDMQVFPSAIDSLHVTLQVAEESLAISQKACSEYEFENRKLMQSAAESVEEATLRGHNSTSRDFLPVVLGVPESPIVDLQRDAELDLK